jgi:hypothetical protein
MNYRRSDKNNKPNIISEFAYLIVALSQFLQ